MNRNAYLRIAIKARTILMFAVIFSGLLPAPAHGMQARFPAAAGNVVIVVPEGRPPFNGLYYAQSAAGSLVICPEQQLQPTVSGGEPKIEVIFFPGQRGREKRLPVSSVSEIFGGLTLLKVTSDKPAAPREIKAEPVTAKTGDTCRVFGVAATDPQPGISPDALRQGIREFSCELTSDFQESGLAGARSQEPSAANGALVCDSRGLPLGILLRSGGRPTCVHLNRIMQAFQRTCVAGWQNSEGCFGQRHPTIVGSLLDRLTLTKQAELLIDFAANLRPDFVPGKDIYDQPATVQMQPVPVVWFQDRGYLNFRGIAGSGFGFAEKDNLIFQCRLVDHDGSVRFTPPGYVPGGLGNFDPITETLAAQLQALEVTPHRTADPVVPLSNEIPENYSQKDQSGERAFLRTGRAPFVDRIAWAPNKPVCYLCDQFGTVISAQPDMTQPVRKIDLQTWAQDMTVCREGLIVVGTDTLYLVDFNSLEVRTPLSVPGVRVATGQTDSDTLLVATDREIFRITVGPDTTFRISAPVPLPGELTSAPIGIMQTPNHQTLILADQHRLHRYLIGDDGSLTFSQSSPELYFSRRCQIQQNEDRIIWRGESSTALTSIPGFPKGLNLVFDTSDLATPLFGDQAAIGLDCFSGGILLAESNQSVVTLLKGDGSGNRSPEPSRFSRRNEFIGSCPTEGLVAMNTDGALRLQRLPESVAKDSMRVRPLSDSPEVGRKSLAKSTSTFGSWSVTELDLPAAVDSVVWADDSTAIILTEDFVLHRIRFPDATEDATLRMPPCTNLVLAKNGLIVQMIDRSILQVVDRNSLERLNTISVTHPGSITAAPDSNHIWMQTTRPATDHRLVRSDDGTFGLICIDAAKGEERRFYAPGELMDMAKESPVKSMKTPWRFTSMIKEIQLSANGRYLFLRDNRDLLRFQVKGDTLKFDDGLWRLAAGNSGPLAFSPDGRFIAMTHGAIPSRAQHPTGGHFGSFVFPVEDFNKVVFEAASDSPCDAIGLLNNGKGVILTQAFPAVTIRQSRDQPPETISLSGISTAMKTSVSGNGTFLLFGGTCDFLSPNSIASEK
ncbi:MAG: hypothetical protein R3C49_11135 [Planctomycetaceae bacterium]